MICHKLAEWKCTHTHSQTLYGRGDTKYTQRRRSESSKSIFEIPLHLSKTEFGGSDETYGPGTLWTRKSGSTM